MNNELYETAMLVKEAALRDHYNSAVNGVRGAAGRVQAAAAQGYGAAKGYAAQGYGAAKGYAAQGYGAAKGYAAQGYGAAKGYAAQGYGAAQNYASQGASAVKGYGAAAGAAAKGYATQGVAAASAAGSAAKLRAIAAAKDPRVQLGAALVGGLAAGAAGKGAYDAYMSPEDAEYMEELQSAKTAAELMYSDAVDEFAEKIAFAKQLYAEASEVEKFACEKLAADNGPALDMPYVDQYQTPAGAAGVGAIPGGAAANIINGMQSNAPAGTASVGAGSLANVGALTAFVNQHRQARAEQIRQQVPQA